VIYSSCQRYDGKVFQTQELAAEKLLSPELLYVHEEWQVSSYVQTEAEYGQCQQ